jgi:carboxypeptidase C (cathepsin A)
MSIAESRGDEPYRVTSEHNGVVGGQAIQYTAVVERSIIPGETGDVRASIVSTSYFVRTDALRPVIFVFNGGPASASCWLHLGLVGPRRVNLDGEDGLGVNPAMLPPFEIVDNGESLLDVADLVLYDPPDTGYSRTLGGDAHSFHSVDADAKAMVEFMHGWLTRHRRWNAPKYLLGESYGSIRAAEVANLLAGGVTTTGKYQAISLNGIVLLAQVMDFSLRGSDLYTLSSFTTLASVARYHHAIDGDALSLEHYIDQIRRFVTRDYVPALYAGAALEAAERERIAAYIAKVTGLPLAFVLEKNIRINSKVFSRELLRGRGLHVGLYDGRYSLPLLAAGDDLVGDDPAMSQYSPAFVATIHDYFALELGVDLALPYESINFRDVYQHWDFGNGPGKPASTNHASSLAIAMRRNPATKLFVGCGYYDLATPMGDAEYTISHADIDMDRVRFGYYESGHLPYLGVQPRRALAADLRQFIGQP